MTPYAVQLLLTEEKKPTDNNEIMIIRKVHDVTCTCVYNQSKKCKHVNALIYFVKKEASLTKTDSKQIWGAPSQKKSARDKYSKGATVKQLFGNMRNKR